MKKILVASDTAWNTNNSFGNSYANIFDELEGYEIANIYCKEGTVNDKKVSRAFKITAKMLLKNLQNPSFPVGIETNIEDIKEDHTEFTKRERAIINFGKKYRFQIFFWLYGGIWRIGKWNSPELERFTADYNPDLLFCPIYPFTYMNRLILELKKKTKIPLVGYISDDNYTLRMVNPSPFYWINRLIVRKSVRQVINQCDILYVISDIQKREYDKIFQKNCRILTKGKDFSIKPPKPKERHKIPYVLVYAGNIGSSRWKTLKVIVDVIREINKEESYFTLHIYTATPLTSKMEKALNVPCVSKVMGKIPYREVEQKQLQADILLHVSPIDMIHRWEEHHGFSTKLVDYMASNRAILSFGLDDQAAVEHLKKHDGAFVASNKAELERIFLKIIKNPGLLEEYGKKAWKCGADFHDIKNFHKMLKKDFESLLRES